jgi:predicted enzyme related to lactoylglutathione lyase
MQKNLEFYRDALGFTPFLSGEENGGTWVVMKNGNAQLGLFQADDLDAYQKRRIDGGHYQFLLYFEVKDLDRVLTQLKPKWPDNIGDEIRERPYGMRELVARDPEGYQITLAQKSGDQP